MHVQPPLAFLCPPGLCDSEPWLSDCSDACDPHSLHIPMWKASSLGRGSHRRHWGEQAKPLTLRSWGSNNPCSGGTPYVEFEVILFFPQALGIESEDDLYKLVNFFLKYQAHHLPSSQVSWSAIEKSILNPPGSPQKALLPLNSMSRETVRAYTGIAKLASHLYYHVSYLQRGEWLGMRGCSDAEARRVFSGAHPQSQSSQVRPAPSKLTISCKAEPICTASLDCNWWFWGSRYGKNLNLKDDFNSIANPIMSTPICFQKELVVWTKARSHKEGKKGYIWVD